MRSCEAVDRSADLLIDSRKNEDIPRAYVHRFRLDLMGGEVRCLQSETFPIPYFRYQSRQG